MAMAVMNPEFDQYCLNHSIILLCMPPHSSHLLQPLDVGCFATLKRSYGRLVEQKMGLVLTKVISENLYLYTNKHGIRHYTRRISRAASHQQASSHTSQIACYQSYMLQSIHHHHSYNHNRIPIRLQYHIMLLSCSCK